MNSHLFRGLVLGIAVLALATPSLFAQKYEANPYGGFVWPGPSVVGHINDQAIWGGRFGYFLDPNFELEGNVGYMNKFHPRQINPKARGLLWEVAGDYNFSTSEFPFSEHFSPFVVVGVGGITTLLRDVDSFPFNESISGTAFTINPATGNPVVVPVTAVRPRAIRDHDTFFTVSYGGGFKSMRVWGPVGFRFEARGRTLPNYYGGSPTFLEATGGFNIMWGER
jgi:hypothetical protein